MQEDNEGFLYPHIDVEHCVDCGICEKVCPVLNAEKEKVNPEQIAVIVQHKNTEVLEQSTAGGAFTAIAEYILDNNGVVFGVAFTDDYTVKHTYITSKDELFKFRNSKYVQSDTAGTFKQAKDFLDEGRLVCYSGTPCQIEGLRHFLRKDYENLVLVDVVCHAVPSPGLWRKYLNIFSENNGDIASIRFRDKALGYQYSTMEIKNKNGKIYRGGLESQLWMRMYFSSMIIRPSCTACAFKKQYRNSDFTIWDCFNLHSIDKDFDENCGTTRVLIHSIKGKKIFDSVKNNIKYKVIPVDLAVKGVYELVKSHPSNPLREQFFKDAEKLEPEVLFNKYFPYGIKLKIKKGARLVLNRMGLDVKLKHILKK